MLLKKFGFSLDMVMKKRVDSLPVYSYACNKVYNPLYDREITKLKGGLKK